MPMPSPRASASPRLSPDFPEPKSQRASFRQDVLAGLSAPHKHLPCKYFYDARGSQLFDQICELEEYYLTRTEIAIMEAHAREMAARIGSHTTLVEFGSGSSVKTGRLLRHLPRPVAYVPVEISPEPLYGSARRLERAFPEIEVHPLCADFTTDFALPDLDHGPRRVAVYFPGSTIGNFEMFEARRLLERIAQLAAGGFLLIGIDLVKDAATLEAAYNDRQGVTAEFNLNLLRRINHELKADFDLGQFAHRARFNPAARRMELSLESLVPQRVSVAGKSFDFRAGERIHTEYSHKYTIDGFCQLADSVNFELEQCWTDSDDAFAVLLLAHRNR